SIMTSYLWLTVFTLALALCVSCQAQAASSDDERELIKILNSRDDVDIDTHRQNRFTLGHTTSGRHAPSGASALPLSSIWYHQVPVLISEEGQAMGSPVRQRPYAPAATYADLLSRLRTALPIEGCSHCYLLAIIKMLKNGRGNLTKVFMGLEDKW
ncbi:hypothetical protein Bpfe_017354, partial [Biomphalaria pfeifferi]